MFLVANGLFNGPAYGLTIHGNDIKACFNYGLFNHQKDRLLLSNLSISSTLFVMGLVTSV
jgi:hypothetical protein